MGIRHEDTSPSHWEELSKTVLMDVMDDVSLPHVQCVNFL